MPRECPSCSAELVPGKRWCPLCHVYLGDPDVGRLASPAKRLWAFIVDIIIPVAVVLFLGIFLFFGGSMAFFGGAAIGGAATEAGREGAGAGLGCLGVAIVLVIGFGIGLGYAWYAIKLFIKGTSPGKKMLKLQVVKEDGADARLGTMIVREWIGRFVSSLVFGLGNIWILIDENKQAWHDKLGSTFVVDRSRP